MERLSKFQQAKIVIEIIEDLKSIEDKRHLTIEPNNMMRIQIFSER